MKQLSLICCSIFFSLFLKSQNVGIGTTAPNASARLEVADTAKGLLIPRLTTAQRNAIASPANGLLVFITGDSSFHYYYNNWIKLSTASQTWNLTGNANTSTATDFIGTTDNIPFTIKVNNQPAALLDSSKQNAFFGYQSGNAAASPHNTSIGFQALNKVAAGQYNVAAGTQALFNNTDGYDNTAIGNRSLYNNTDGFNNTAAGDWALLDNISGYNNAAFGKNALIRNTNGIENSGLGVAALGFNRTGNSNTALGFLSLYNDTTGNNNTAAGKESLYNTVNGNNNTAFGFVAGRTNVTGSNNTFVGSNADVTAAGLSNAGAIGYNAKVAASNSFVIGGTGADAVNVGIGTSTPSERLDVAGNIKATGTITPSDERFKKNIVPLKNNLQKLLLLDGVSYYWKQNEFANRGFTNQQQLGFIAQDVEKVFPQLVHTGNDGYKGLDYAKLIPVLVEAIKEQQKEIEVLKKIIRKKK